MGCGVEGKAILIAPDDVTTLLFTQLGRIVVLLTQGLPVGLVPEQLLSLCYLILFSTVHGLFKPVRFYVVNDSSRDRSTLSVAHHAEGMRFQKCKSGFVPAAVIDAWLRH